MLQTDYTDGPSRLPHKPENTLLHEGEETANRAYDILKACGVDVGADFQALGASQVEALLAYADQHRLNKYGSMSKYRQSPNSNDSRVRSFYDLLQRRAARSR